MEVTTPIERGDESVVTFNFRGEDSCDPAAIQSSYGPAAGSVRTAFEVPSWPNSPLPSAGR